MRHASTWRFPIIHRCSPVLKPPINSPPNTRVQHLCPFAVFVQLFIYEYVLFAISRWCYHSCSCCCCRCCFCCRNHHCCLLLLCKIIVIPDPHVHTYHVNRTHAPQKRHEPASICTQTILSHVIFALSHMLAPPFNADTIIISRLHCVCMDRVKEWN